MSIIKHPIRPGGLSPADHARIDELAAKGWRAPRIAREIEKHPSTVLLRLYRQGWRAPEPHRDRRVQRRAGRIVRPFTPDEDTFIEGLRVQGLSCRRIAEAVRERFGYYRAESSVWVRLLMLANREAAT